MATMYSDEKIKNKKNGIDSCNNNDDNDNKKFYLSNRK